MAQRSTDKGAVHVDRVIPLWGLLSVLGVALFNGIVVWVNQGAMAKAIADLVLETKELNKNQQTALLATTKLEQTVADQGRRLLRAETKLDNQPQPQKDPR